MTNTKCNIPADKIKVMKRAAKGVPVHKKICDLNYLINITRGNREKMNGLLAVFLEETPKELTALTAAIEKTDYAFICDVLHKIKCSFSILGIASLTLPVNEMNSLSAVSLGIEKIKQLNRRVNLIFRQAVEEMRTESGYSIPTLETRL